MSPLRHMHRNGMNTSQMASVTKVIVAVLAGMIVLLGGTIGFMLIESMTPLDAVYMTVITLSTVGFGEVRPLHPAGRILAMVIIVFGVGLTAYFVTALGQFVLEGQLRAMFGRRMMDKSIKKLSGHAIIGGFGRVGRQVANEFARAKKPFVVIEKSADTLHRRMHQNWLYIEGEATDEYILREAGIDRAKVLVSTLPDEANNVYLTLTARDMNPKLNIIARADYEGGETKLKRAGANRVVSPHVLGGLRMATSALRPSVGDFMHMTTSGTGELTIEEMALPEGCDLAGKTIAESRMKQDYGVTIIGLKKGEEPMQITPGPGIILDAKDTLVVIGPMERLEELYAKLR